MPAFNRTYQSCANDFHCNPCQHDSLSSHSIPSSRCEGSCSDCSAEQRPADNLCGIVEQEREWPCRRLLWRPKQQTQQTQRTQRLHSLPQREEQCDARALGREVTTHQLECRCVLSSEVAVVHRQVGRGCEGA